MLVAVYTHITTETRALRIQRNGIAVRRRSGGVFAMPVLPNFYASHQWVRELRRRSRANLVAVDFRIEDREEVLVGHYGKPKVAMTAAQAAVLITNVADPRGYEVCVQHRVSPTQVLRIRAVPQLIGWRYWPDSHGHSPCGCPICSRGEYGSAKLRERRRKIAD